MPPGHLRTLILLSILVFITRSVSTASPCYTKLSAQEESACMYQCHCLNATACDKTTGACPLGCADGWFGPACQYESATFTSTYKKVDLAWLTDDDATTCNQGSGQAITVTLETRQPLAWIRVVVNNTTFLDDIQVSYRTSVKNGRHQECTHARRARVDDTTVDISCNTSEMVRRLKLSGRAVQFLCSLYISGGRNVAFKEETEQSSTYATEGRSWNSFKAVDGYDGPLGPQYYTTCTHTATGDAQGWWMLTFQQPVELFRVILYNRKDCCMSRLVGFTLQASGQADESLYSYTDSHPTGRHIYTIIPGGKIPGAKSLRVTRGKNSDFLTLCEVLAFGDVVCQSGKFGRECERNCNCAVEEACFVSTGGCPSGCAPGYTGEDCHTPCPGGQFGAACTENCSVHCEGPSHACSHEDGSCDLGCQLGYLPPLCTEKCPEFTYGGGCSGVCNVHCLNGTCHHVTGTCQACVEGREGEYCEQDTKGYQGVIIGAALGVTLGVIIIVAVLFVYLYSSRYKPRKRINSFRHGSHSDGEARGFELGAVKKSVLWRKTSHQKNPEVSTIPEEDDCPDSVYNNILPGNTAVSVQELRAYLHQHAADSFLKDQFESIPLANTYTKKHALAAHNAKKNRYKNIVPYDHSRVQLNTNSHKKQEDYINASFIKDYDNKLTYIAAQAPTDLTLTDFVRMLWEQRAERVVMLTNVVELRKIKSAAYWPQYEAKTFGEISVSLLKTQVYAEYTIRHLKLSKSGEIPRLLTQFHFTAWPDHSVPYSPWGLVDFQHRVLATPARGPLLVHCSAGVGRTGTFIGLCHLLKEAEATQKMDFLSTLWRLRQDRMSMIQTVEQYIFLHKIALAAFLTMGTSIDVREMHFKLGELAIDQTDARRASSVGEYGWEFKALSEATFDEHGGQSVLAEATEDVYQNSKVASNKEKNRVKNILPKDIYRPVLACEMKNLDKYINAVFVPSLTRDRQDILTQLPLPSTVTDFWRMATQFQVGLVVAFEADARHSDETVGSFLPDNDSEPIKSDLFEIQATQKSETSLWQEMSVVVFKKRMSLLGGEGEQHMTCLLLKPTGADLWTDPGAVLDLLTKVRSCRPEEPWRTVFMCRNGADYSGLACVLSILLARLEIDQCLTVPLVVGAIKAIRPQVIPTVDQYRCLYAVLKLHQAINNIGVTEDNIQTLDTNTDSAENYFHATENTNSSVNNVHITADNTTDSDILNTPDNKPTHNTDNLSTHENDTENTDNSYSYTPDNKPPNTDNLYTPENNTENTDNSYSYTPDNKLDNTDNFYTPDNNQDNTDNFYTPDNNPDSTDNFDNPDDTFCTDSTFSDFDDTESNTNYNCEEDNISTTDKNIVTTTTNGDYTDTATMATTNNLTDTVYYNIGAVSNISTQGELTQAAGLEDPLSDRQSEEGFDAENSA